MNDEELDFDIKGLDVVYGALVIAAFFLGIVVTHIFYQNTSNDLHLARQQLRKVEIYALISDSIIETIDADFEAANNNADSFFDELKIELDKGEDGILYGVNVDEVKLMIGKHDETIAALENQDKSSFNRLKAIQLAYIKSVGKNSQ